LLYGLTLVWVPAAWIVGGGGLVAGGLFVEVSR
jgi:hypothetical protein